MADLDLPQLPDLPDLPDAVKRYSPNRYVPSPEWGRWIAGEIIGEGGALHNPEHADLQRAHVAVLLTNEKNTRSGSRILGTAQEGEPSGKTWSKGPRRQQLAEWYGSIPDFLITLDGYWIFERAQAGEPVKVLALIEHELYHMAQDGFSRTTGKPKWKTVPHDVEEFVGVVRRYGAGAPADKTRELVQAAQQEPEIAAADLDGICGTCKRSL